jgi:hypothetical protein
MRACAISSHDIAQEQANAEREGVKYHLHRIPENPWRHVHRALAHLGHDGQKNDACYERVAKQLLRSGNPNADIGFAFDKGRPSHAQPSQEKHPHQG